MGRRLLGLPAAVVGLFFPRWYDRRNARLLMEAVRGNDKRGRRRAR